MEGIFRTDVGQVRSHNEDNGAIVEDELGQILAFVADGMGGHQAGDVASEMAKEMMVNQWNGNSSVLSPKDAEAWLMHTVEKVNDYIYQHSINHKECEGMGTTLVAAILTNDFVSFSNVGDSRIYLFEQGYLKQITEDHSLVNELVRSGELSESEAMSHPGRNVVLRALGTEATVKVDVESITWEDQSLVLLCSDGLTDKLSHEVLEKMLAETNTLDSVSSNMVKKANELGGEDNITLALIRNSPKGVRPQ